MEVEKIFEDSIIQERQGIYDLAPKTLKKPTLFKVFYPSKEEFIPVMIDDDHQCKNVFQLIDWILSTAPNKDLRPFFHAVIIPKELMKPLWYELNILNVQWARMGLHWRDDFGMGEIKFRDGKILEGSQSDDEIYVC